MSNIKNKCLLKDYMIYNSNHSFIQCERKKHKRNIIGKMTPNAPLNTPQSKQGILSKFVASRDSRKLT